MSGKSPFVPRPPVANGAWKVSRTLVFQVMDDALTAPTESQVSAIELCALLSAATGTHLAGTAASFQPCFHAVRVRKIELWQTYNEAAQNNFAFPPNTTGIFFAGAASQFYSGDYRVVQALDPMQPGYLSVVPPAGSAAAMWNFPSAVELFRIINNKDTRVVLHLDFIVYLGGLPNTPSVVTYSSVPSDVAVGQLYALPLDGTDTARLKNIAVGVLL